MIMKIHAFAGAIEINDYFIQLLSSYLDYYFTTLSYMITVKKLCTQYDILITDCGDILCFGFCSSIVMHRGQQMA